MAIGPADELARELRDLLVAHALMLIARTVFPLQVRADDLECLVFDIAAQQHGALARETFPEQYIVAIFDLAHERERDAAEYVHATVELDRAIVERSVVIRIACVHALLQDVARR